MRPIIEEIYNKNKIAISPNFIRSNFILQNSILSPRAIRNEFKGIIIIELAETSHRDVLIDGKVLTVLLLLLLLLLLFIHIHHAHVLVLYCATNWLLLLRLCESRESAMLLLLLL